MTTIQFYEEKEAFGEFSNFYKCKPTLIYQGKQYATSEHLFQAMKYIYEGASEISLEYADVIRTASTANISKCYANQICKMGGYPWTVKVKEVIAEYKEKGVVGRVDWHEVKDGIMREILLIKFTSDKKCKKVLISTGDSELVEHTSRDAYWGDNGDGTGKNMLGKLLMEVRALIK